MCSTVLPYELIHAIFELAASESLHAMFTLLLVSRETHKWCVVAMYQPPHPAHISQAGIPALRQSRAAVSVPPG